MTNAAEPALRDDVDAIQASWRREMPDAPVASIGVITRIWRIARLLDEDRRRTMNELGMDVPTRNLLSTLRRSGPPYTVTVSELARRSGVTSGAVSQWIARAEAEGHVHRRRSTTDARQVEVTLTRRGQRRIDAVVEPLLDHEESLVSAFDQGEVDQLAGLLRRLLDDLERRRR